MLDDKNITIIEPEKGWNPVNFREIWKFRELLYFLAWRDIKVKYKQTAIGISWALLQPVLTMLVFSFLFGYFARVPSDGVPYPIFVFIALLPWQYFAAILSKSANSVVNNSAMVTKIYFPRLLMPFSPAISSFLDFVIASLILLAMMIYYGITPGWGIFILPFLVLMTVINAVGFGLWLAAINVKYRDIQHAVPFLVQIWMFVTPVIYPVSLLGNYKWFIYINPMGGVIEAFRPALLGHAPIPWLSLFLSSMVGIAVFIAGAFYFRRMERNFADII